MGLNKRAPLFEFGASSRRLETPALAAHLRRKSGRAHPHRKLAIYSHWRSPETKWAFRDVSWDGHKNQQIRCCAQSQNDESDFAGSGKTDADGVFAFSNEPKRHRAKQCRRCKEN